MFVLTHDLGLGDAGAPRAAPPTWPPNPEPIAGSDAVVNAPAASSLDWGSAGIGAGAGTTPRSYLARSSDHRQP
jgi:hypothetical protein